MGSGKGQARRARTSTAASKSACASKPTLMVYDNKNGYLIVAEYDSAKSTMTNVWCSDPNEIGKVMDWPQQHEPWEDSNIGLTDAATGAPIGGIPLPAVWKKVSAKEAKETEDADRKSVV